ncbi:hypothetical protein [Nocardia farcinica]|uniref:hypothetical protein n=1 Tax=Nocardia farcinica TaxID=37329 RepID=UPI00245732C6|nr:hypothetical protein [Nocardia farcinica]
MGIAALILWILTAAGGLLMFAVWIAKGGARQPRTTHLPPPVLFGHLLLAVAGLIVWIVHLLTDHDALAWIAFVLLLPVALLGAVMLLRWLPVRRERDAAAATDGPPERHFPVVVVLGHGVFAVATVILVLATALEVGN